MRERDESGPLNESSINKRGLSASHRYDRRRNGTNRCTRNPLFSIQKDPFGETSRLDVSGACLVCIMASPLKLPTSFALFFAASSIPGPLSLSVSSLSIYLSLSHCPLFPDAFPTVACVSRTFRSLSIPHFHPLVYPLSLCSCFRVHFVTRQPHELQTCAV